MKFEEKLIKLRKQNALSQEELAEKLNVTRQTISKWELGQSKPDMDKLIELSKLFEMSLDEFSQKYSSYYDNSDMLSIGEYKVDYKMALMAVLQRISGRLLDVDNISKEEINNIVEELYYKYTESDLLEMLYEEYKKTGKILVLDENNKLIPLC